MNVLSKREERFSVRSSQDARWTESVAPDNLYSDQQMKYLQVNPSKNEE